MNEKLPKPMLDALARGAAPAQHPSADVLAGFMERALGEAEVRSVSEHLAGCGECREVVFLASNAAEERVADAEELLVAAAAQIPQERRAAAHVPARFAAARPAMLEKPRRRWMPRLRWAAPVAVVFLVAAGYFSLEHFASRGKAPELASNMQMDASRQAAPPQHEISPSQPSPTVKATLPAAKPQLQASPSKIAAAKAAPASKVPPEVYDAMATSAAPSAQAEGRAALAKTKTDPAKAEQEAAAVNIGGAQLAAPVPKANGFAPSAGDTTGQFGAADSLGVAMNRAVHAAHPGWRVTAQGHLEHLTDDGWRRVLAERTTAFRAVAVVGDNVWAGGSGGALFHSSDDGAHWKKITVAADGVSETGGIVSVSFDDPQHGVVTADGGATYATSDGGVSWTKQQMPGGEK